MTDPGTIESLTPGLREGEEAAYRALVRALGEPLYAFAHSRLRDTGRARDAVQTAFIRVFRQRAKLEHDTLRAYCFRIVENLTSNAARDDALRKRREQEAATMRPEIDSADPERTAVAREAWRAALDLPGELRDVVMLYHGQGFSLAEAGAVLDIPKGTVQTRLQRALETLRARLGSSARLSALPVGGLGELLAGHSGFAAPVAVPPSFIPSVETAVMATIGQKSAITGAMLVAILVFLAAMGGLLGVYLTTGTPAPSGRGASFDTPVALGPAPNTAAKPVDAPCGPAPARAGKSDAPSDPGEAPPPKPSPGADSKAPAEETSKQPPPVPGKDEDTGGIKFGGEPEEGETRFRFTLTGTTVDSRNTPLGGCDIAVHIYLWNRGDSSRRVNSTEAIAGGSNNRGEFRIPVEVAVGANEEIFAGVSAAKSGYAASNMAGVRPGNGEQVRGLRLELPCAITAKFRCVDMQGKGIGGVDLLLEAASVRESWWPQGVEFKPRSYYGTTDAQGCVAMPVLALGRYKVKLIAEGFEMERGPACVEVTGGLEVMEAPEIVMQRVAVFCGHVVDEKGKRVNNAQRLKVYDAAGIERANVHIGRHTRDGFVVNVPGIEPGRYRVFVVCGGQELEIPDVDVRADTPTQLGELKLISPK